MLPRPEHEVRTIMSWPVATIDHEATLQEVAEALAADVIGAVLVLREGALVGVVSERDVVAHVAAGTSPSHLSAGEVMAGEVVTTKVDATIIEAARTMAEADVRHLPVLQDGLLAGVVSVRDVLPVLAAAADEQDVVLVPSGARVVVVGQT
jgi:CBS domain-containing protein